jgi:carbon monoxide dehydrogenase subunit G
MELQTTIEIQAKPADVWRVMADVERWHEWTPSIENIELLNGREIEPGVRAKIKQPKLPTVTWTVDNVEPGRSFSWVNSNLGTKNVGIHTVEPSPNGGSRVTLTLKQSGFFFALMPWIRSMSLRYMEMEAQGLKKHSEAAVLV